MVQHRDLELATGMGERYDLAKLWQDAGEGYEQHRS